MQLPDGREMLVRIAAPLPITVVAEICDAVKRAADRLGYTNVQMMGDAENVPCIVATPPARPQLVEDPHQVTR